jgi:hypothetical protein
MTALLDQKWNFPLGLLAAAAVVSMGVGFVSAAPADVAFVVSAKTRSLTLEWPCADRLIDWTLPAGPGGGTQYRTADMPAFASLGAGDVPGRIQLRAGSLADITLGAGGAMLITIRPSGRQGDGAIAELFPAEGASRGVSGELYLRVPAGSEPLALPLRGIFRLGGVLSDGLDGSPILEQAMILARGQSLLARETQTFLTEQVGAGSLIFSHPELEALSDPVGPFWAAWCRTQADAPSQQALGLLQFGDEAPLDVSFIRYGREVGLKTLGAAVPDDDRIVLLSVPRWRLLLSSAWAQTGLVLLAALLAGLNYFYQADGRRLRLLRRDRRA